MTLPDTRAGRDPAVARVTKRAERKGAYVREVIGFANARSALRAFLTAMRLGPGDGVLLPSYIGWSPREGSGVFDPVREVGAGFGFYRMCRDLSIDLDDLRVRLDEGRYRVLVVIHYFGYRAEGCEAAVGLARERGIAVVEDEAHSVLSDWVGGVCGRLGDAAMVSFHKLFPVDSGGALVLNASAGHELANRLHGASARQPLAVDLPSLDLAAISEARRRNARVLAEALQPLGDCARPLFPVPPPGVVPQSFPVLIEGRSRDEVYFEMNHDGFGVVSLYHTLIPEIDPSLFPDAYWLSTKILNLPVHQDATEPELVELVRHLAETLGRG